MGVVGANQKKDDGNAEQELFRRGILVAVVNLLPEIEVVVGTSVELKGDPLHPVEHDVRTGHVGDVGERPRGLLRYAGDDVVEDFEADDEDKVDGPGTYGKRVRRRTSSSLFRGMSIPLAWTHSALRFGNTA